MSEVQFDQETLLQEARDATGLSDFGSDDFREGLGVLIETIERNPFTEKGRHRNRGRLLQLLGTRLRVQEALRRHPEIRERPLVRPMFLTGLPRSGTSALFNLLAADPAGRPLLLWESQFPDPLEGLAPGAPDPRHGAVVAHFEKLQKENPEFIKMHFVSADTPEECVLLHAFAMHGAHMGYEILLEPYASWFQAQDLRGLYAYQADLMRMLDWQRPGERWLLKSPAHLWGVDAIIDTFPDVCIVWNHRDPAVCIASIASMTHMIMGDQVEMSGPELGPILLEYYALSLERGLEMRERNDPARFVDVPYDAFVGDSMGQIEKIYGHFGLPLPAETRAAMEAHIQGHPKDRFGKHEYALADFGLTEEQVRERILPILERFGFATDFDGREQ